MSEPTPRLADLTTLRLGGPPDRLFQVTTEQQLLDVERLFVAPRAFRRGVGSALLAHVVARAGGRRVIVATGQDNHPARVLYERAGFAVTGRAEVEPGLWVTHYAWAPAK